MQLDLLLEAAAAVREVLAERLVLDEVPADPEAEPELPVRQQVDLGRLLGEQRRLALRRDDDARDELELGRDCGDVPEDDEDLVELVLCPVRACQVGMPLAIRSEHVVVREQMIEAELLRALRELADAADVGADLRLGKDDAELQRSTFDPPTMASRPSPKRTHALPLPS